MPDVIETTAREEKPAPEDDGGFDYTPPAVPALREKNEAVSAVADAMLAMPGVAGRDEFLSLAMQAKILSMSGAAPEAVRNNPYIAFHVALVGRDLGLSPSAALELIDVIPTRNGPQLSLSPQLMNAQVHRVYGGEIVKAYSQPDSCTAVAVGPGGRDPRCRRAWPTNDVRGTEPLHYDSDCSCDILGEATFTWEDAQMAGLASPTCQPGAHVKDETRRGRGDSSYRVCGCNQGYITYPKRMMWQRSCGFAADDYFPGAGLGLYTPEALGSMVDEEGRAIDPATVELPEGYEPEPAKLNPAEEPADPDDLWTLQVKLHALPEEQQQAWREQKMKQERLAGRPTHSLSAAGFRVAAAMVNGLMSAARRKGWDEAEACEEISRLVAVKLISFLTLSPPEGEDEPGTPDPGPDTPEPESAIDLLHQIEAKRDGAPDSGEEPLQERPDSGEPAEPGPTAADAAALTVQVGQVVDGMRTEDVRTALRDDFRLPSAGGAKAVRERLIRAMVAAELEGEEPF